MSFIDCSLVTLIPDNNSASVSFGTIISISDNNSLGNAFAGPMSLMTPKGLIYDEGIVGTIKIINNALKKENRPMFCKMFKTMTRLRKDMDYITFVAKKEH